MDRQSYFCIVTQLINAGSAGLWNLCFPLCLWWKPRAPEVKQRHFFVKICHYGALGCPFTPAPTAVYCFQEVQVGLYCGSVIHVCFGVWVLGRPVSFLLWSQWNDHYMAKSWATEWALSADTSGGLRVSPTADSWAALAWPSPGWTWSD